MNPPIITVSYNGGEKMMPLLVHPSLELSDAEVQDAHLSLHTHLRRAFRLSQKATYYIHEVETGRILTQESYRDPSYCPNFPSHWYLVLEKSSSHDSPCLKPNHFKVTIPSSEQVLVTDVVRVGNSLSSSSFASRGTLSGSVGVVDEDELAEVILPSLADMTTTDTKYHSYTLHGPGDMGCTLRYFSIQPPCLDMLTSDAMSSLPHSRSDSLVSSESLDALKLSTIFVGDVRSGSEAERVGLDVGFVVHMINKESILRCSVADIQLLLNQCGNEVTLLGLPQESDDLQYLYPTYTQGEPGVSNTEDGEVMVLDTSLILGSVPLGHGKQPSLPPSFSSSSSNEVQLPSSSPPVGMTLFVDHTGSQDNSQSCVLEHLSCDQSNDLHCGTSKTDDILVLGSLLEIGGRVEEEERRGWQGHREDTEDGRVFSQDSLLQLNQLDVGGTSPRLGLHRLAPSENGVDDVDGRQWYTLHDTEEGRTASANVIVREGRTSLEELTRIHSDRTLAAVDDKVVDEAKLNGHISEGSLCHSSSSHEYSQSDKFATSSSKGNLVDGHLSGGQLSGGQLSGGQLSGSQLSGQSVEGIMSSHYLIPPSMTEVSSSNPKLSTSAPYNSNKRAVRGYKSKRAILHRMRNKSQSSDNDTTNTAADQQEERTDHSHSEDVQEGPSRSSPITNGTSEGDIDGESGNDGSGLPVPVIELVTERDIQKPLSIRASSSKHEPQRRLSAMDVPMHTRTSSDHTSSSSMYNSRMSVVEQVDPFAPLFTTRTALTPSGEQVVREVNIEDAIRRSQGRGRLSPAFQGHIYSQGDEMSEQRQDQLKMFQNQVICRGILAVKQDTSSGRRQGQDRAWAWRDYYAVLSGTLIKFYREKKEADSGKSCEEPSLDVVPATIELDPKNTRRKFAFRLVTGQGTSYLLQADDAPSRQRWVDCIKQLNGRHNNGYRDSLPSILNGVRSPSLLRPIRNFAPISPKILRRVSSPTPPLSFSKSTGTSLLDRIKRTLTRSRDSEDLDYSSFTTFSQPLQNCPVSPENKRVPLVVEFCVHEVEKYGLDVEGIYRKPGLVAMINQMSAQMDKGHYLFEYVDYGQDIHTCGSLLKKFFKELTDPLIANNMYPHFLACARLPDEKVQLSTLKELVIRLPTAHYHTLRYLIRHLVEVSTHCDHNKMTLRNVALVFGPTIMRGLAGGDEMLNNMTAGYTIVELLCKHVEYLCEDELCLEEVEKLAAAAAFAEADEKLAITAAIAEEDEKLITTDGPVQPVTLLQKKHSLYRGSPRSMRKTRNKSVVAGDEQCNVGKPHSTLHTESISHVRDPSWNSSGSVSQSEVNQRHNTSLSSLQTPSSLGDEEMVKKRVIKHMYEDVEILGQTSHGKERSKVNEEKKKDGDSRTMNWIKHHREMNWGREANPKEREITGSLWSSRNRGHQQLLRSTSGEKLKPSQLLESNGEGERRRDRKMGRAEEISDLFTSYQGAAPQYSHLPHHPGSSFSSAVEPHMTAFKKQTPDSSFCSKRRVSYVAALATIDIPVQESTTKQSTKREREDRFSTSEQVPARYQHSSSGRSSHGHGQKEAWKVEGGVQTSRYAQASPTHLVQQRITKQSSLQQNNPSSFSPSHSVPLARRRSSECMKSSTRQGTAVAASAPYHHQPLQAKTGRRDVKKSHRTFSNDRMNGKGDGPPIPISLSPHKETSGEQISPHHHQEHHSPPTPHTAQVESYI